VLNYYSDIQKILEDCSVASANDSELPDSREMVTSAPASQDREFKTPELPQAKRKVMTATLMQQQEIERQKPQTTNPIKC
jgi:hypothetical protein